MTFADIGCNTCTVLLFVPPPTRYLERVLNVLPVGTNFENELVRLHPIGIARTAMLAVERGATTRRAREFNITDPILCASFVRVCSDSRTSH